MDLGTYDWNGMKVANRGFTFLFLSIAHLLHGQPLCNVLVSS